MRQGPFFDLGRMWAKCVMEAGMFLSSNSCGMFSGSGLPEAKVWLATAVALRLGRSFRKQPGIFGDKMGKAFRRRFRLRPANAGHITCCKDLLECLGMLARIFVQHML